MDRPLQLDISDFRLLSDEEFKALPLSARLEYLKAAVRARSVINSQIEETLFRPPDEPQS